VIAYLRADDRFWSPQVETAGVSNLPVSNLPVSNLPVSNLPALRSS
jgi:hypothetical protein